MLRTSMDATTGSGEPTPQRPCFVTTHWSVVLQAGRSDTTRSRAALEKLCRLYWLPLYAFARRSGWAVEDAQDLTQEFFRRFIERNSVSLADPDRGRFRSFLLVSLKRFLADEWDRLRTQKRGSGRVVAIDPAEAEERCGEASAANLTPERVYEKRWAMALLEQVYRQLESEHATAEQQRQFHVLRDALTGDRRSQPYRDLAARLGTSEGAVRVAVHRLRQRYRQLLRQAIADTVAAPDEVEDELRHLFTVLAS